MIRYNRFLDRASAWASSHARDLLWICVGMLAGMILAVGLGISALDGGIATVLSAAIGAGVPVFGTIWAANYQRRRDQVAKAEWILRALHRAYDACENLKREIAALGQWKEHDPLSLEQLTFNAIIARDTFSTLLEMLGSDPIPNFWLKHMSHALARYQLHIGKICDGSHPLCQRSTYKVLHRAYAESGLDYTNSIQGMLQSMAREVVQWSGISAPPSP